MRVIRLAGNVSISINIFDLLKNMATRGARLNEGPHSYYYSPALKKWVNTGFGLSDCPSFRLLFCHNLVSAHYLKNKLIEFYQILYSENFIVTFFITAKFSTMTIVFAQISQLSLNLN